MYRADARQKEYAAAACNRHNLDSAGHHHLAPATLRGTSTEFKPTGLHHTAHSNSKVMRSCPEAQRIRKRQSFVYAARLATYTL